MKKLLICFLLLLCSCRSNLHDLEIEKQYWTLSYILDQSGEVAYCSFDETDLYPTAKIIELECFTDQEIITIKAEGKEYSGHYRLESIGEKTTIYSIVLDTYDFKGISSYTKEADQKEKTFVISNEKWTIYLKENS